MRKFVAGWFTAAAICGTGVLRAQDADAFGKLDANKDGSIALAEVPDEYKAKFEQLLKIAGKEADKKLSLPLFQAAMKQVQAEAKAALRKAAIEQPAVDAGELFPKLDANKDGSVALSEVPEDFKARFERLLKIAGKESDKKLSLPLFQAAMKQAQTEERAALREGAPDQPTIDAGEIFAKLDANKDGFVAGDEVPVGQKSLFDRLVRNADANGDKQLSAAEFQTGLKPANEPKQPLAGGGPPGRRGGGAPQEDRQRFERLDANKDGKLSKEEPPQPLQQAFARLDANSDGSLSPAELVRGGMQVMQRPGAPGTPPPGQPGAPGMQPPQQLAAIFDQFDANKDGKLTKDEVPAERQMMRLAVERAEAAGLTKDEFVRAMAQGQPPMPLPGGGRPGGMGDGPRAALGAIDVNRDGELSKEEIEGAAKALLTLDRNGDGKLSREEIGGPPPMRPPGAGRPMLQGALQGLRDRWKESDANGDGKLSKDEAPAFLKERFDRIDANSDGFLDETEVQQLVRRQGD